MFKKIIKELLSEKFVSKAQQRFFYAQANKKGKEGKKWAKMAKEFSDRTDYDKLPEKVDENLKPEEEEDLKELPSFSKRVSYIKDKYPKLGQGSSRAVFDLLNGYVLKLAINKKGVSQNKVEDDYVLQNSYSDIIAPVYKNAEDYTWIISKKANKITESKFYSIEGYKFLEFKQWIATQYYENTPNKNRYIRMTLDGMNKDVIEKIEDSIFANEIKNIMLDFDFPVGDLMRISSYGEIDGEVVLVDYGLNNSNYQEFYTEAIELLSNTQKIHHYLDNNERFKNWFSGASHFFKNSDDTPKIFYHGTRKDFDSFHDEIDPHVSFPTYYFTDNTEYANRYALGRGGNVIPVVINARNILDTRINSEKKHYINTLLKNGFSKFEIEAEMDNMFMSDGVPDWKNYNIIIFAKNEGYDGVYLHEREGIYSFCLFNKRNIKSVFSKEFGDSSTILDEDLRDWFREKWVRIDTQGNITGECGIMKDGKKTTRCLPKDKAEDLTKSERKATTAKKTSSGRQFVKNTKKAEY